MHPTDASDAHLADRAIELRALKGAAVVFGLAFAARFVSPAAVFGAFALAYLGYKLSYHTDRVGVFDTADRRVRHNRLELAGAATVAAAVGVLVATETVFREGWTLGGVLSLPPVDFTDLGALLGDPLVPLAWAAVAAPAVAVSYLGLQFRHRLLFGVDSEGAAVRAAVWESLARPPVYLLWVAAVTAGPVYDLWEPLVGLVAGTLGVAPASEAGFAVVFGASFGAVALGGLAVPLVVVGAFVGLQRWKYDDATVPEVFGHPGIASPSLETHPANLAIPAAVYLLYAVAVLRTAGFAAVTDLGVVAAVVVSLAVGADVLGRTSMTLRSASERMAESVDATVTGFALGFVVLAGLAVVGGLGRPLSDAALAYPLVALPLTHLGNRVAGRSAVGTLATAVERVEADPDTFEERTGDLLFVYGGAWDDTLRAAALEGLATVTPLTGYRREDALEAFVRALDSDEPALARPGLRGIAAVLAADGSAETHERLLEAGASERILAHLDSDEEATEVRATEAAARLFTAGVESTATATEYPSESRFERMADVVDRHPGDRQLTGAVLEYFAAVWYAGGGPDSGIEPTDREAQEALGGLLRLADHGDERARLTAALSVTSHRAAADPERFALAVEALDSDHATTRFAAANAVRTSMDRHADRVDAGRLLGLLEDEAPPVREAGARALLAFVQFAPDRGEAVLDDLVFHLQERRAAPEPTEGYLIRALGAMDVDTVVDHPSAATAVAAYVDGAPRPVAEAAASLLAAVVKAAPETTGEDAVGAAIETGLTHASPAVRLDSIEAAVAVVGESPAAGRRYVPGLAANVGAGENRGGLAAVCLSELLEAFPEDGLEVLPALADGIGNLTPVHRQAVPFPVRGSTVSAVTVDVLTGVVPIDPGRGRVLVGPLTDFATTADGATLEGVFGVLAELSAEFPGECREAVGTAAALVEDGRPGVRRAATRTLANVAAHHPEAVEPFVDRLLLATDDDSPRVRAAALVALANVSAAAPRALEGDVHRVVGLLDDDSTTVRERAAGLVVAVAERAPGAIDPAAETADRLRRLQRDPAVDFDPERLQDASTAIQTGTPLEEGEAADADEEIWTPESGEEMGASGDTEVFEPAGEFDDDFGGFEDPEPPASNDEPDGTESVEDMETQVGAEDPATAEDPESDPGPETEAGGAADAEDVEGLETAIEPGDDSGSDDVEGLETAIEPGAAGGADDAEPTGASEPEPESEPESIEGLETAIEPSDGEGPDDVEGLETAIEPTDDTVGEEPGGEGSETTVETGEDSGESGGVDDLETAIEPSDTGTESTEGVENLDTTIEPTDDTDETEDVENLDTAIEPTDDTADAGGVEDLETVIDPGDAEDADDTGNADDEEDGNAS